MDHELTRMIWAQVWQVSLLILAVAVAGRFLGKHHPHFAHGLWVIVLVKAVTPPLWSSPGGVFSRLQSQFSFQAHESEIDEQAPANIEPPATESEPVPAQNILLDPDLLADAGSWNPAETLSMRDAVSYEIASFEPSEEADALAPAVEPVVRQEKQSKPKSGWMLGVAMVWGAGALGTLLLAFLRWLACLRDIRRAARIENAEAEVLLEQLIRKIGLRKRVRLVISTSRLGPAVMGVFRPVILIPYRILAGEKPADLEPILAHELIHIRRGDLWIGWLQLLVQAVWWFHPFVWWAGRLQKREAERCCDEEVVAVLRMPPARYARALVDVLELKHVLKPVPVLPGVKPVEITTQRLERIMKLRHGCRTRTPWWCYAAMLFLAAVTLPGAAYVASAKDKPTKSENAETEKTNLLTTKRYRVGDVLDRIQREHGLDDSQARVMLANELRSMVDELWNEEKILVSKRQAATPWLSVQGNRLTVKHTRRVQEEIARQLEVVKKNGFSPLEFDVLICSLNKPLVDGIVKNWKTLSTKADKDSPLPKAAILSSMEASHFVEACQNDPRTSIMSRPKVRTLNGRPAKIEMGSEVPIVVFDGDGSRRVEFVSEGISLEICPTRKDDKIELESGLELTDIQGYSVVKVPAGKTTKEMRYPKLKTSRINTKVLVPDGGSVLLGGAPPLDESADKDQRLYVLVRVNPVKDSNTGVSRRQGQWERSFVEAMNRARAQRKPLLVYLSGDWCKLCRDLESSIFGSKSFREKLGTEFIGVRIDVDKQRELAKQLDIDKLPTVLLFSPDGKELKRCEDIQSVKSCLASIGNDVEIRYARKAAELSKAEYERALKANRFKPGSVSKMELDKARLEVDRARLQVEQAQHLFGVGVNSDAGLTGSITIDEKNFNLGSVKPPTDDEVIKVLKKTFEKKGGEAFLQKTNFDNVRIVKEPLSQRVDPPRFYPQIGPAQMVHSHYKCTVYFDKITESAWPVPFKKVDEAKEVVYIDRDHLIRLAGESTPRPLPPKAAARHDRTPPAATFGKDASVVEAILWDRLKTQRKIRSSEGTLTVASVRGKTLMEPALEFIPKGKSRPTKLTAKSATVECDLQNRLVVLELAQGHYEADGKRVWFNEMEVAFSIPEDLVAAVRPEDTSPVQPASYLKDDVQYFPAPPAKVREVPTGKGIAAAVEEFNRLFKERRYQEAKQLALEAFRNDPKNPVTSTMFFKARVALGEKVVSPRTWDDLTQARSRQRKRNDETAIEAALKNKVSMHFEKAGLDDVMKSLAKQTGMDIVIDNLALAEEGIKSDHPVTINVDDVSCASALKLILQPLNLTTAIEDEVLKVTSQTRLDAKSITVRTYPVADLVIPILQGDAGVDLRPKKENEWKLQPSDAQIWREGDFEGRIYPQPDKNVKLDFETLIDLIQCTVEPDTWDKKGGFGSIRSYETTLSLVIRQTGRVHEEIADLLQQLRRLQDLQVTYQIRPIEIEVIEDTKIRHQLRSGKVVSLGAKEAKNLIEKWTKSEKALVSSAPKVTLFNGQRVSFILPSAHKEGLKMELNSAISADRRFVRMHFSAKGREDQLISQYNIKDGHSVLLDLTRYDDATSPKKRKLVMITPTVIVQEEEEELLGLPAASAPKAANITVTPRVIIQEEEEELIGIPESK